MILTEHGSISPIIASEEEEEEENAIAIDHHNCVCYKCYTFGNIDVADDDYCYSLNAKSEIVL